MIEQEKRKAIYALHKEGIGNREIGRRMGVSKTTVSVILGQEGVIADVTREDKIKLDEELLIKLYDECRGWVKRMHEKLEEQGIKLGYSTLTQIVRELGIGESRDMRCERVPDVSGDEMQHDTSVYKIKIGDKIMKLVCSILYFRYSKMRYIKFYPVFNRFAMKCFFYEALSFFGYCAKHCIIDNTNLARLRGTGKNAIINPEMEQFGKHYGFKYVCHAVGVCNRKAGNERSFFYVETSFLAGRNFESLEDLNKQVFEWATVKLANAPVGKSKLIPSQAFEHEKPYLIKLPSYVPRPYLQLDRGIDQYGYVAFDGNFYWVCGKDRRDVKLLRYSDCLKIYRDRQQIIEYELPAYGVKNELFSPKGFPKPKYSPQDRRKPTQQEEKKLRNISEQVDQYMNFALKPKGIEKHRLIRELFALSQKITTPLFIKTIERALKYGITDIRTIERIAILQMNAAGCCEMPFTYVDDQELQNRQEYIEGRITDDPDLSKYDKMLEDDKKED